MRKKKGRRGRSLSSRPFTHGRLPWVPNQKSKQPICLSCPLFPPGFFAFVFVLFYFKVTGSWSNNNHNLNEGTRKNKRETKRMCFNSYLLLFTTLLRCRRHLTTSLEKATGATGTRYHRYFFLPLFPILWSFLLSLLQQLRLTANNNKRPDR